MLVIPETMKEKCNSNVGFAQLVIYIAFNKCIH